MSFIHIGCDAAVDPPRGALQLGSVVGQHGCCCCRMSAPSRSVVVVADHAVDKRSPRRSGATVALALGDGVHHRDERQRVLISLQQQIEGKKPVHELRGAALQGFAWQ